MRISRIRFAAELARADMSCKQLAERTGLSRVTISNIRQGKSCARSTAERIADGLGVSLREIVEEVC